MELKMKIKIQKALSECNLIAWRLSRPAEKDPSFEEVAAMDLPVNEFDAINLSIESTILEREIFTTLRNHIMWAQTSRVTNPLKYKMHYLIRDSEFDRKTRSKMVRASQSSRQDDYRLELPILSLTEYSISTNPRQLLKIALCFNYLSEVSASSSVGKIFSESSSDIKKFLSEIGYNSEICKGYKTPKILFDGIPDAETKKNGQFMTVTSKLPFSLRAQLVRHRNILFTDDLLEKIKNNTNFWKFKLKDNLTVSITCDADSANEISQKRSCWVAHYGLWAPLLNKLNSLSPGLSLPCDRLFSLFRSGAHSP